MTDIVDRLSEHFARQRRQSIVVDDLPPEAGGALEIFFDPLTTADLQRLQKRTKKDSLQMLVHTVISKALTEDGTRMFEDNAKCVAFLNEHMPVEILSRIGAAILGKSSGEELGE